MKWKIHSSSLSDACVVYWTHWLILTETFPLIRAKRTNYSAILHFIRCSCIQSIWFKRSKCNKCIQSCNQIICHKPRDCRPVPNRYAAMPHVNVWVSEYVCEEKRERERNYFGRNQTSGNWILYDSICADQVPQKYLVRYISDAQLSIFQNCKSSTTWLTSCNSYCQMMKLSHFVFTAATDRYRACQVNQLVSHSIIVHRPRTNYIVLKYFGRFTILKKLIKQNSFHCCTYDNGNVLQRQIPLWNVTPLT